MQHQHWYNLRTEYMHILVISENHSNNNRYYSLHPIELVAYFLAISNWNQKLPGNHKRTRHMCMVHTSYGLVN